MVYSRAGLRVLTFVSIFILFCANFLRADVSLTTESSNEISDFSDILPVGKDSFLLVSEDGVEFVGSDGNILRTSLPNEEYIACDTVRTFAADQDGDVTIQQDGNRKVIQNLRDVLGSEIEYHPDRVSISCNQDYIFYYDDYGEGLHIIDVEDGQLLSNHLWSSDQNFSVVSPTGDHALLVSDDSDHYLLWSFPNGLVRKIPFRFELDVPKFSGDESVFSIDRFGGSVGSLVEVYSTPDGSLLGGFLFDNYALSNNGRYILGIDENESSLRIYEISKPNHVSEY